MNKLVIFDIDGTLTQTYNIDGICFESALSMEFGISEIEGDWSQYLHTTDFKDLRLFKEKLCTASTFVP